MDRAEREGAPRLGSMFGRYRIESLIGRGGMGVVVRATDLALDRPVALKFLAPELRDDPGIRERFLREPRLAAAVEHPNIVPIHEAGEVDGIPYIAMRAIPGRDLAALLRREAPLDAERTRAIVSQIASALDAAHRRGLVHRDVKPGNVMVEPRDDRGQEHAWLTDFGLTRRLGDVTVTAPGPIGTPDHVPPEVIAGEPAGPASDQYALACLAVRCITGDPPWSGDDTAAVLHGHLHGDRNALAARIADPAMAAAIIRGLAVDAAARWPDCASMARAMAGEPPRLADGTTRPVPVADPGVAGPPVVGPPVAPPAVVGPVEQPVASSSVAPVPVTLRRTSVRRVPARRTAVVALVVATIVGAGGLLAVADQGSLRPPPSLRPSDGVVPLGSPSPTVLGGDEDGIIVFSAGRRGQLDLWAIRPDGIAPPIHLTETPGDERYPTVTPDGRTIIYSAGAVGSRDLYSIRADGTGRQRLTRHPGDDYAAAVSPDGSRIAWTSDRDGTLDILVADLLVTGQLGEPENITLVPGRNGSRADYGPAWGPDGSWLVFASNRLGSADIWWVDPQRPAGARALTSDSELWADNSPTVDPDGSILFVGARGHDDREIYRLVDGRPPVVITNFNDDLGTPDVAPDGRRIVVAAGIHESATEPLDTRLMILGRNGGKQNAILLEMPISTDPAWVPALVLDPVDPPTTPAPPAATTPSPGTEP